MSRIASPVLASVVLIGALGLVHGVYSDRWGPSGQLEQALQGLERVPSTFGDWVGEDVPFEPADMARAGIKGTILRQYRNQRTRESVSVLLVCGRGGPICVHTPDICYAGAGYRQTTDEKPATIEMNEDGRHTFRTTRFGRLDSVSQTQLEIFWTWSRDGRTWEAPENPRLVLARSPALYKLYVVREFIPGTRGESVETCRDFLLRALPDIRKKLPVEK